MKTHLNQLYFDLPEDLIALYPSKQRDACRLLEVHKESQTYTHKTFYEIINSLNAGDLLVFNDVKVDKARIYGKKDSGSIHEVLLLSQTSKDLKKWLCIAKKTRKLKKGDTLTFTSQLRAILTENPGEGKIILEFNQPLTQEALQTIGEVPLPPYIKNKRAYQKEDEIYYQTIFAKEGGAKAAPTAGLHFSDDLLVKLKNKGIEIAFIRLFVSLATFEPIKTTYIEDHPMHQESFYIEEEEAKKINQALKENRRIIAVGTTVVRALESAFNHDKILFGYQTTKLFITPGYSFKVVKGLITNFHTPYSTLLLMVSAFMGKDFMIKCYQEAMKEKYYFFSYGDAMFIF